MSMNQQFRQVSASNPEFIRLMEAQHRWTRDMIDDWLTNKPWEYGSIDSADYMEAALRLSDEFTNVLLCGTANEFLKQLSYESLMSNYACDGVCPELFEKYPDPEEAP